MTHAPLHVTKVALLLYVAVLTRGVRALTERCTCFVLCAFKPPAVALRSLHQHVTADYSDAWRVWLAPYEYEIYDAQAGACSLLVSVGCGRVGKLKNARPLRVRGHRRATTSLWGGDLALMFRSTDWHMRVSGTACMLVSISGRH